MSIMTAPRRSTKTTPATKAVTLSLTIGATAYDVQPIPAGEFGTRAFRLHKLTGDKESYDVIRTHAGLIECSCPAYECNHRQIDDQPCKHGAACASVGLLIWPQAIPNADATPIAPKPVVVVEAPKLVPPPAPVEFEDIPYDGYVPPVKAKVEKVSALDWSTAITGRYWEVATQEQKDAAVAMLNSEYLLGVMMTPVGPPLPELGKKLVAMLAPKKVEPTVEALTPSTVVEAPSIDAPAVSAPLVIPPKGSGFAAGLVEPDPAPCCSNTEPAACRACATSPVSAPVPGTGTPSKDSPLARWVAKEASRYRGLKSAAADLIADTLDDLARSVRFHGAQSPAMYRQLSASFVMTLADEAQEAVERDAALDERRSVA
jgi:hypothetical protein